MEYNNIHNILFTIYNIFILCYILIYDNIYLWNIWIYNMLHTHTPIIGQFIIQKLPTSVFPRTATDGLWIFSRHPSSEPQADLGF